jgi:CheY-like chemotaxis protein
MLRQTIGPEIVLVIESQPDLHPAWVDPNQFELAILNLALNARDAMPTGGALRIDAKNRRGGIGELPLDLRLGDYVVVSVSDTGTGMKQETLARAFEPFFTTKEAGRGSGLGLSIVHGFAVQSEGTVQITSSPGKGTKVDLWLPRSKGDVTKCGGMEETDQSVAEPIEARILVCDDDVDVLAFVGMILRDSGYTVWEAKNPPLALELFKNERSIDLLLVDYAMPEMNGLAIIDRARAGRQGLKVILMSGHADILHAGDTLDIPLLAKPFKAVELRRRIAEVLLSTFTAGKSDPRLYATST